MSLTISGISVKQVPIKPKEIEFDKDGKKAKYVDKDGKQIKEKVIHSKESIWVYEDNKVFEGGTTGRFKAIKGKAVKGFSKTDNIEKTEEVSFADIMRYSINVDASYYLVSSPLKEMMKKLSLQNKGLKFKYVNRGFKIYDNTIVYYDEVLDRVIMKCGRSDLRQADMPETTTAKESVVDDGVATLDLDAM